MQKVRDAFQEEIAASGDDEVEQKGMDNMLKLTALASGSTGIDIVSEKTTENGAVEASGSAGEMTKNTSIEPSGPKQPIAEEGQEMHGK